eukprot:NODE_1151_length_979_cov_121.078495_g959_i0.p3 GENE.NODE_1151_length_979_cov_121.078495_g959_i0~~NODE_1151_length_979_cov_121.078495_g959_i0.p3  ORF type:complete len:104 (+),score=0.99 NODE_1151_length_979_cov_121.078495_g959_i0:24-314(+)
MGVEDFLVISAAAIGAAGVPVSMVICAEPTGASPSYMVWHIEITGGNSVASQPNTSLFININTCTGQWVAIVDASASCLGRPIGAYDMCSSGAGCM